jgi:hypothetical protein
MSDAPLPSERLCRYGLGVLYVAALLACFYPMAGLPTGLLGSSLFLYGSWKSDHE